MSYPDPGYGDDPFREDVDSRSSETTVSGSAFGGSAYSPPRFADSSLDTTPTRPVTAAELDDVFDDPEHGQPGMDRMGVHVLWEILLLVSVVLVAFFFRRWHSDQIAGDNLKALLLDAASLGVVATGMALSLRAGVVNLAVGPIAVAAGLYFAEHAGSGMASAIGESALLAAGLGAAIGLVVVIFQVPSWAASLAGALAAVVWINKHPGPFTVSGYDPAKHAIYWYAGFAALSVLGGLLGLFKTVRRGFSRYRPVADPARRRGVAAGALAFVALAGSGALAGLGGGLGALSSRTVTASDNGALLTVLALGAVLAGGTSAFGRRGGVFGTLLAVTLLVLLIHYGDAADWKMSPYALAGGAIGVGLVLTRLVETLGRPRSADGGDGGDTWGNVGRDESVGSSWGSQRPGSWGSQLPARSVEDTWGGASDDRWGAR
jgi:ribose/xylose/arabinose/galactoside ABC-type transport system permease subunit